MGRGRDFPLGKTLELAFGPEISAPQRDAPTGAVGHLRRGLNRGY